MEGVPCSPWGRALLHDDPAAQEEPAGPGRPCTPPCTTEPACTVQVQAYEDATGFGLGEVSNGSCPPAVERAAYEAQEELEAAKAQGGAGCGALHMSITSITSITGALFLQGSYDRGTGTWKATQCRITGCFDLGTLSTTSRVVAAAFHWCTSSALLSEESTRRCALHLNFHPAPVEPGAWAVQN